MTQATPTGDIALAEAQAELQRHRSALARMQGDLMASRQEVAGTRAETVQFQGFLRRAQVDVEAAHAHIAELRLHAADREAVIVRLDAELAALHRAMADLGADIRTLRTSVSWRISAPVRLSGRLLRRLARLVGR